MASIRTGFKSRGISATEGTIKGYAAALCDLNAYDIHDALAELWKSAEAKGMPAPGIIRKHVASRKAAERARAPIPGMSLSDYDTEFGQRAIPIMKRMLDPNDPLGTSGANKEFLALASELAPQFSGRGGDGAEIRMRTAIEESSG